MHVNCVLVISGTWGLGNIIGPMLGGVLARRWPRALPFLLPNVVSAAIAVVALLGVRYHIPCEARTRENKARRGRA